MRDEREWRDVPEALAALSRDLERTFAAERAVLPSGMSHRVMLALPRPATGATRFARMLAGVVLLGSGGVLALAWQWLVFQADTFSTREMLLPALGGVLALTAVLVAFSLPATAWWRWRRRTEASWGVTAARDAAWVLAHRVAATALLAAAAAFLSA